MKVPLQTHVTPEAPWLGLRAFTEDLRPYFFGRDRELDELFERIAQKPLTVLFGQSGLGKTSLIQAALMPRLQSAGFARVLLRLDHGDNMPPLEQQLLAKLRDEVLDDTVRVPDDDLPAPLWRLLHDPAFGLCREGAPRVVLMLDQFEEIFTLGENSPARRDASRAFLNVLADVVENRVPAALRPLIEDDEAFSDRLNYGARPLKLLISLREDFLHRLERWRAQMPSLMDNRLELRLLTGPQALQAVLGPGKIRCKSRPDLPPIVSEETGAAIVRFVADADDDVPLAEIDAVPPLLSLLCAELNDQRGDSPTIRAEQIEGRAEDILTQFYDRCFAPHPLAVRRFVEDRLLSPEGFRQNANEDTFLHDMSRAGVGTAEARSILAQLVDDRLIVSEERGGIHRIELTHDTLTGVARTSRDQRMKLEEKERAERELVTARSRARLRRFVTMAIVLLTLLAGAGVFWALRQKGALTGALAKQQRSLADADYRVATHLHREKDDPGALQHLARALKLVPEHPNARVLTSFLLATGIDEPQVLPEQIHELPDAEGETLSIDLHRRYALSHDGEHVIVRDPVTWKELFRSASWGRLALVHFDDKGGRILAYAADGQLRVIALNDRATFDEVTEFNIGSGVRRILLTPDGKAGAAILRDVKSMNTASGNSDKGLELVRFFKKGEEHFTSVRGTGVVESVTLTPDGASAFVNVLSPGNDADVLQLYATDTGEVKWVLDCDQGEYVWVVMRADSRAFVKADRHFMGIDAKTGIEWFDQRLQESDQVKISGDGQWSFLTTANSGVLTFYPPETVKPEGASGGGIVVGMMAKAHDGEFMPDNATLIVTSAGSDSGGLSVFHLDAQRAMQGLELEPEEYRSDGGGMIYVHPGSPTAASTWSGEKLALILPDPESGKWLTKTSPLTLEDVGYGSNILPLRVDGSQGLTACSGIHVYVWDGTSDYSHGALRESAAVSAAWFQNEQWVTATAKHVALWRKDLDYQTDFRILGSTGGKAGPRMKADETGSVVRVLPNGQLLWLNHAERGDNWGLADPSGDWVMFSTWVGHASHAKTLATCTPDGAVIYVVDESGKLLAWDTRSGKALTDVAPPEDAHFLALHPTAPRALYRRSDGRCIDYDLALGSVHAHLGTLPGPTVSFGSAVPLHADDGWLVVAQADADRDAIFRLDARHEQAVQLSSAHPANRNSSHQKFHLVVSPSGRHLAAVVGDRYDPQWCWCATAQGEVLLDQDLHGNARVDMYNPFQFDASERFFGFGRKEGAVFDLETREKYVVEGGVELAERVITQPPPAWLPKFLEFMARPDGSPLLSRAALAQELQVSYPSNDLYSRMVARWLAPAGSNEDEYPPPSYNRSLEDWRKLAAKDAEDPEVQHDLLVRLQQEALHAEIHTVLQTLLRLYEAQAKRAPLNAFHSARYGEALLLSGRFAEAAKALGDAARGFTFEVDHRLMKEAGKLLKQQRAYALWLSDQKPEAIRYAKEQHFHDWLWDGSALPPLAIYRQAQPEYSNCDAELRAQTPKADAAALSTPLPPDPAVRRDELYKLFDSAVYRATKVSGEEAAKSLAEAEALMAEVITLPDDSQHYHHYLLLANVQKARGRKDEAAATLAKADALLRNGFKARIEFQARLRVAQERQSEALRLWGKVARGDEPTWDLISEAAAAARHFGQFKKARDYLREKRPVKKRFENNEVTFFHVLDGWLSWELGEDDEAINSWEQAEIVFREQGADVAKKVPHVFTRANWLPALAAAHAKSNEPLALQHYRECLRENPALALPEGLAGEFAGDVWRWRAESLQDTPALRRLDVMRDRLRALHGRLAEDERIAAEAAALLAAYRTDEAVRTLATAAPRFPDSPWIALQQAAAAAREHDDVNGIEHWRRAFVNFARLDAVQGSPPKQRPGVFLDDDVIVPTRSGRPQLHDFLLIVKRALEAGTVTDLATLLEQARAVLPSPSHEMLDAWLLLAAQPEDPQGLAGRLLERAERNMLYEEDSSERDAWQVELKSGLALHALIRARPAHSAAEAYAMIYETVGIPGDDLKYWRETFAKWNLPKVLVDRFIAYREAAAALPAAEILRAMPKGREARYWLRELGHIADAVGYELQEKELTIDERCTLLMERNTAQDREQVIKLLQPVKDTDSALVRHLLLAKALSGSGRKAEALDLLVALFQSLPQRGQLIKASSGEGEEAIALIVDLASALGHSERALPIIRDVPSIWRYSELLVLRAGWLAAAERRFDDAAALFGDRTLSENTELARLGEAIARWEQGRTEPALDAYVAYLYAGDSGNADPADTPAGFPMHLLPVAKALNAALRKGGPAEFAKRLARCGFVMGPQLELWRADVCNRLEFHDEALAAARASLAIADANDTERQARTRYHLASQMRQHSTAAEKLAVEAEGYARDAARLAPDKSVYWEEWIAHLAITKKLDEIPAAFRHLLNLETTSESAAIISFLDAFAAGGLPLVDQLFATATAHRQQQLRDRWIRMNIDAGQFQRALDLVTTHRASLDESTAVKFSAFALAGLGRMDEAVSGYLLLLSLSSEETKVSGTVSKSQWDRLSGLLRSAVASLPGTRLLDEARSFQAISRERLNTFARSLHALKRWPDALPVYELLLVNAPDNHSGSEISIFLAQRCLDSLTPPDPAAALRYLSKPLWTLAPDSKNEAPAPAFEMDDTLASDNVITLFASLTLRAHDLTRRCVALRQTALTANATADSYLHSYTLEMLGDHSGADLAHAAALKRFGPLPTVLSDRGWVLLFHRHQLDEAQVLLAQILAFHQLNNTALEVSYHQMNAAIHWLRQDKDGAIEAYRQLIALDAQYATAEAYGAGKPGDGTFWPPAEVEVLEPLRQATLAKYPDLLKPTNP